MSDEVRLRYPGLVVFASKLISVGTGLIFILMVTRSLTIEEFGIYGNLGDILGYFSLPATIIPFWVTRFTARKHPGSPKTGLIANLMISTLFTFVYLTLLPIIMAALQIPDSYMTVYAILSIQIIEIYTFHVLEAILRARRPQAVGYGLLVFESLKVFFGFIFVFRLGLGIFGAIISVILAYMVQIIFYLKLIIHELRERIRWSYIREWLKASLLNIYFIIGDRLRVFILVLLFVYGGELARAYYGAAATITSVISYSSFLAFSLYPRLLSRESGDGSEDVYSSFKLVFMFSIPMTIGAIILSDSYLAILKLAYVAARPIMIILAIHQLLVCISSILTSIVTGTERLDAEAKISYRDLIRSRLFLIFTLPYIHASITIPLTYISLTSIVKDAIEAAIYMTLINAVATAIMLSFRYRIARSSLRFSFPFRSMAKYTLASVAMALPLYFIPHPVRLSATIALTILGGAIYMLVLATIDEETRKLVRMLIDEGLSILSLKPLKN